MDFPRSPAPKYRSRSVFCSCAALALLGAGGADAQLEQLRRLSEPELRAALAALAPAERDAILGASALFDVGVHRTGKAFEFDWTELRADSARFSLATARALAILATRAYEPFEREPAPERALPFQDLAAAGFAVEVFHGSRGTDAFLLSREDTAVLVFRGTEPGNLKDLLADASFLPTAAAGGFAHHGFVAALDDVYAAIERAVAPGEGTPPRRLLVAGHSLGAALAVLAAARLDARADLEVAGVYAFGMPRTFDSAAAAAYTGSPLGGRTWRFVADLDAVARLPPRGTVLDYVHVGALICFDPTGLLRIGAEIDDRERLPAGTALEALTATAERRGEPEAIYDHGMAGYAKHLYVQKDAEVSHWHAIASFLADLLHDAPLDEALGNLEREAAVALALLARLDADARDAALARCPARVLRALVERAGAAERTAHADLLAEVAARLAQ